MSDPLSRIDERLDEALGSVGPNASMQKAAEEQARAAKKTAKAADYKARNEKDKWRDDQEAETSGKDKLPDELVQALEKLVDQ